MVVGRCSEVSCAAANYHSGVVLDESRSLLSDVGSFAVAEEVTEAERKSAHKEGRHRYYEGSDGVQGGSPLNVSGISLSRRM